jgi:hypothetical protein
MTTMEESSASDTVQVAQHVQATASDHSVAAGSISNSPITIQGKLSHEDFIRFWNAKSPGEQYKIFWDSTYADYRCDLLVIAALQATAAKCIETRLLEGDGDFTSACVQLIWSIPSAHVNSVVDLLDQKCRPAVLRGIAELVLTDNANLRWHRAQLAELAPGHLAYTLQVTKETNFATISGHPVINDVLRIIDSEKLAQLVTSEYGSGSWLLSVDSEKSAAAVLAAVEIDCSHLAKRLIEIPVDKASELLTLLASHPEHFHRITEELSKPFCLHLVAFMATARRHLPSDQLTILLPTLQKIVGVWPWWAAINTANATSAAASKQGLWGWLVIWWRVRNAAADWTEHLQEQRKRERKIFFSGMATVCFVLLVWVVLSNL